MKSKTLTARGIPSLSPGKYIDGEGLVLVLTEKNRGKWVLRLTRDGKRREMGLGAYPAVSLAEARTKAAEARKLARDGQDPIEARRKVEPEPEPIPTFAKVAAQYIADHSPGWRNVKHAAQWSATLAIGTVLTSETANDQPCPRFFLSFDDVVHRNRRTGRV